MLTRPDRRRRGHAARSRARLLALAALLLATPACEDNDGGDGGPEPRWRVYALEYGRTAEFRRSTLLRGEPKDQTAPFSWQAWLIRGKDRTILVDTGFADRGLAKRWRVEHFRPVPEALASLKIEPAQVSDVILTHLHWDHAGNLAPYTRARVWLQRRELHWARTRVSPERPQRGGLRLTELQTLDGIASEGRLRTVDPETEVAPGVILHAGGGHTKAIQWVEIQTGGPAGTVVLASDTAYLYESLERGLASGSTYDPQADVATMKRMRQRASRPELVIPGHDPAVLRRFPRRAEGVVEIR